MSLKHSVASIVSLVILGGCSSASSEPKIAQASIPPPEVASNQLLIKFGPTTVKRMGLTRIKMNANGWPDIQPPREEELVRGKVTIGDEEVPVYLPKYGPYSAASKEQHSFSNTSTRISVDSNHNGELDKSESWWASLPVRLGDQMFDVNEIDPGGQWLLVTKSPARLAGVVVGKPCPPFQFQTPDGRIVALADYKGKALLLDVWSMT